MKLFVHNNSGEKVYLKLSAPTRRYLVNVIGSSNFILEDKEYNVNEVIAEPDSSNTATGAIIGGLIGLIGGPIGAISGSTIGGIIGNSTDKDDVKKVSIFNNSYYE